MREPKRLPPIASEGRTSLAEGAGQCVSALPRGDGYEERSLAYEQLVGELLEAQRRAIVPLRNEGAIGNDVMHRVERDLDLEDSRLEI